MEALTATGRMYAQGPFVPQTKENKSGHLWDWIETVDGVDKYRIQAEYDSHVHTYLWEDRFARKFLEIAPAIEPTAEEVVSLFDMANGESLRASYEEGGLSKIPLLDRKKQRALMSLVYEDLGFGAAVEDGRTVLWLPQLEHLYKKWGELQDKNPELALADLDLFPVIGISSDEEYLGRMLEHQLVVSLDSGKVHDFVVHLTALIANLVTLAVKNLDFNSVRAPLWGRISLWNQRVVSAKEGQKGVDPAWSPKPQELEMLTMALSAAVDGLSADTRDLPSVVASTDLDGALERTFTFEAYRGVALKRFGKENLKRFPLLLRKLEEATGSLYGYPDDDGARQLLAGHLKLAFGQTVCWIDGRLGYLAYDYQLKDGRLIVGDGSLRFEKKLKGALSIADLNGLPLLILKNQRRVNALYDDVSRQIDRREDVPFFGFAAPQGAEEGDYSVNFIRGWRYFRLSVVEDPSESSCRSYYLKPGTKDNELGFYVEPTGKSPEFVRADSYQALMTHLKTHGVFGHQLVRECEFKA